MLTEDLRSARLDDILGPHLVLLGIGVGEDAWSAVPEQWPVDRLDVVLDDLLPSRTHHSAIGDLGGALERTLSTVNGHFVLVRPDRYVAAVVTPGTVRDIGALLRRHGVHETARPSQRR